MCIPLDKPQLKALMKEIDTDRSGEVDFEEVDIVTVATTE